MSHTEEQELLATNPLVKDWSGKLFGIPPFDEIHANQFEPAFNYSMKQHLQEVEAIAKNADPPSFENTVAALSKAGALYSKISHTFHNLCSSLGTPDFQAVELKMAGALAAHYNQIATYPGLFPRIDALYEKRDQLSLNSEQKRLVERYHLDFIRAGAKFTPEIQARYTVIVKELAELAAKFSQNVTLDVKEVYLELTDSPADLAGLPEDVVSAAKQAGIERNLTVPIVTTSRSLIEPFLTFSSRRDLREKAWRLWSRRGELHKDRNNLAIAKRMLQLRAEKAKLHGYNNFAEFALADTMAGSPQRVMQLLEEVWNKAQVSIEKERKELMDYIKQHEHGGEGGDPIEKIEPWDWRYYAEKVRIANYNLDTAEVKPYFPLNRMTEAIFDCAHELFGLEFVLNPDFPKYHPDINVYEVYRTNPDSNNTRELQAIFVHDNYNRPYKKGGAWMSSFRVQQYSEQGERIIPIIINNNNFNKPGSRNGVTLLSFNDGKTLFHEFGHGLHGMLSDVHYQRLAGTSVLRDFVELPSQLYEHWLSEPIVLEKHAKHYQTNTSIPLPLLEKMEKASNFNQGFQTIEYTISALVDIYLHQIPGGEELEKLDLSVFEKEMLEKLHMPEGIIMRHRLPHFEHLFAAEAYASAYYCYLWAEVLDADGFQAFKETGNCFDREVAERAYRFIYSAGNSREPSELFRLFRGRDPVIEPMLRKKGLIE